MNNDSVNNRIAKNTLYLYLRMLMVMVVSLYTIRVILHALGAVDYGIYNVVGGIVAMFTFLNSILNSASLRFFAYNIGKNDKKQLSDYFTMSFWCFMITGIIVVLLAETIGLWFVYSQLNIPLERMNAAIWVYHLSVFTFVINLLVIPYSTIIIAHERMNMYAVLGIIECLMKLGVAYLVIITPFDGLKTYAVLTFITVAAVDIYYVIYDLHHFPECGIKRFWDTKIFNEIAAFSGWTMFGAVSGVLRSQGINILLNIFFNPVVNAARAIAYQLNNCVNQFVLNFFKAVQPQITKYYGAKKRHEMISLVLRSSRYCFYLILLLSMPILLETNFILILWLKKIPDSTVLFTRLVIVTAIVDSISYPLQTAISATGKIKYFQIITGGLLLLILPVSWIFLKWGYPPEITMYISIVFSVIAQCVRIVFARIYTNIHISDYIKSVAVRIMLVTTISFILPTIVISNMDAGIMRFIAVCAISLISSVITIYIVGISKRERHYFNNMIKQRLHAFR